jgi:hypothetical protein
MMRTISRYIRRKLLELELAAAEREVGKKSEQHVRVRAELALHNLPAERAEHALYNLAQAEEGRNAIAAELDDVKVGDK